jgi:hypothetical protein
MTDDGVCPRGSFDVIQEGKYPVPGLGSSVFDKSSSIRFFVV